MEHNLATILLNISTDIDLTAYCRLGQAQFETSSPTSDSHLWDHQDGSYVQHANTGTGTRRVCRARGVHIIEPHSPHPSKEYSPQCSMPTLKLLVQATLQASEEPKATALRGSEFCQPLQALQVWVRSLLYSRRRVHIIVFMVVWGRCLGSLRSPLVVT
eukprot:2807730-Amphidinium_carterae.1